MTQINFASPAHGDLEPCATKYPIVLLHGLGYRDDMPLLASWGRIPDFLRLSGAKVFLGGLEAWDSIENNAAALKIKIEEILAKTGANKVNIIAHSKGGLEARYMISHLGMADKIASYTSVCTPHSGTSVADLGIKLLPSEHEIKFKAANFLANWIGDKSPNSGMAIKELTRTYMTEFNRNTEDAPGVYYQSFGTIMTSPLDDPFFMLTYPLIKENEGDNDGMVSTTSCPWGVFRGLLQGKEAGISHLDMVDFRKHDIAGVDIAGFYVAMVADLKVLGY
jgi:triacylglycerol lipase